MRVRTGVAGSILAIGVATAGGANAQDQPPLVAAYAAQLAQRCGTPPVESVAGTSVVERLDLNGDKLDDWLVDASRYPCPGQPAIAARAGAQVTIFKGVAGGVAVPAFQVAGFGAHLRRDPSGAQSLWVTLGGADCGDTSAEARCERQVVWRAEVGRFDIVAPRQTTTPQRNPVGRAG